MLMIQKAPERMTPHGEKLLAVIRGAAPNWISRSDIAEGVGKKRLTPYDVAMLELLEKQGLIESTQKPGSGRDGFLWEYRAKG